MSVESQHMMAIMYAPENYTHWSHFPEQLLSKNHNKLLLNFWLLRHGKLSNLPDIWHPNDIILSQLLSIWSLIPVVAHLVGGYLLRNILPHKGALLMSDSRLLAFISLPLQHNIRLDVTKIPFDTTGIGLSFILEQLPTLPEALRQRLLLLFPVGLILPKYSAPRGLDHINLLQMAIKYAQNY